MKSFRFGVNVWNATSRTTWVEKARKIEDLGYSTLTVPDRSAEFFAPIPALVSAAEATTRLRIGTNVLNNDLRQPVLVAQEAGTIDLLTDGRLQLGLRAGHMKSEYDQAGLSYDAAGTRIARLAEAGGATRLSLSRCFPLVLVFWSEIPGSPCQNGVSRRSHDGLPRHRQHLVPR